MVYKFNTICSKISAGFFAEIDKLIWKFIWKLRRPRITKTILKNKNIAEIITLPAYVFCILQ